MMNQLLMIILLYVPEKCDIQDTPFLVLWADGTLNDDDDSNAIDVPKCLRRLEQGGARLKAVPSYGFVTEGNRTTLNKGLSVYFTVDTVCTSQDIFCFDVAGIEVEEITSIQRETSSRLWVVSFATPEAKEQALNVPAITIAGCQVLLGDSQNQTVLVICLLWNCLVLSP